MSTPVTIDFKNVSLSFLSRGKEQDKCLFKDFNLSIHEGEFVSLVGHSGCGKTTLLRLIGGLLQDSDKTAVSGVIDIHGATPEEAKQAYQLGFAFQNAALLPWRTVMQNIILPLEISGRMGEEHLSYVDELISLMSLEEHVNAYPNELSGGQQQRVNIARALVLKPRVLLMDEPFGALDEFTREHQNVALHKMHRAARPTIVFVTHSLSEAVFLSNRIVILKPGTPCTISDIINVTLPDERTSKLRTTSEFFALERPLREVLFVEHGA